SVVNKNFRETLWFKIGKADEQAAADQRSMPIPLPIEDRYIDTSELSREEIQQYGLHTGTTEYIPAAFADGTGVDVPMSKLVGEMKRSKRLLFAIGAGIATIGTAI